ncbi:Protein DEL-4 [Aphelenchoides avenae]|nr:Protein DEL-4 [Aphelenchus avenae]
MNYFKYPVNVQTSLETGTRGFPSITFCNINPWKLSGVAGTPLQDLVSAYNKDGPNSKYGFTQPASTDKQMRAVTWMRFMYEELAELDKTKEAEIGYTYEDLFATCQYSGKSCDKSYFNDFYDAYYGRCFTFNQNGTLNSTRAGPLYGFRAVIRANLSEYLPRTDSAGVMVFVHTADETPFEDAYGYFMPQGLMSSVGVKYFDKIKMGSPYSTCTDDGSTQPIYYSHGYEVEACVRSCLQDRIVENCGCYDPQFNPPMPPTSTASQTSCYNVSNVNAAINCANKYINSDGETWFNVYNDCDCPPNCRSSYYAMSVSTGAWPAKKYVPPECKNSSLVNDTRWANQEDCLAWYKENTLAVEVYYERLTSQIKQETQGYRTLNALGDAGGAMGLWLGMSVVSLIEFFIFGVIMLCFFIVRPKAPVVTNYDYFETLEKQMAEHKQFAEKFKERQQKKKANVIYEHDKEMPLPPAVQDSR